MPASRWSRTSVLQFQGPELPARRPVHLRAAAGRGLRPDPFDPPTMLFLLFVIYGLSGYVLWAWRHWRGMPSPIVKSAPASAHHRGGRRRPDRRTRTAPRRIGHRRISHRIGVSTQSGQRDGAPGRRTEGPLQASFRRRPPPGAEAASAAGSGLLEPVTERIPGVAATSMTAPTPARGLKSHSRFHYPRPRLILPLSWPTVP